MDQEVAKHFADIIKVAQSIFEQVSCVIDETPERAILRIQAEYGEYRIFVTELFSHGIRKYRYYLLRDDWVEAGFDNSPDPRAIRLKYGKIGKAHADEYVPHLHLEDKARLLLTEEITFFSFISWLEKNIEKTV